MNLDELVPMPEPEVGYWGDYTADQLRAYGEAVAAAVANRCAQICDHGTRGSGDCADAIRREFGEVSNG